MNVLIATGLYPPDIGGPATYSKILKDELPKHGISVEVLSFGEVRSLPKIIRHFVYFLKCLWRGRKTDLIFAQDPVSVGFPSLLAAKILRKKFILKIVGDYAWEQFQAKSEKRKVTCPPEPLAQADGRRENHSVKFKTLEEFQNEEFDFLTELRRETQKFVANKADRIIVPSEYLKRIVGGGWRIEKDKIAVIYNCAQNGGSINRRQDNERKDYILSIGRLVPWKGFDVLIEVMAELPEKIKLVIIGDGPEFRKLKIRNEKLRMAHRIKFIGRVGHDEAVEYFNGAGIFILNTAYEGLSHVILEAMACGVPIIATNIGGNPELIEGGHNGILVEYNNKEQLKEAILKLWDDAELRQKFIENSYEKLGRFSLVNMIERTIEVLRA